MSNERISDEQLSAWLDGELPATAAAQVEAWLAEHPEDAARVQRWAADRDALRSIFGPVAAEPVPAALQAAARRRTWPELPRWAMAAAAAGLLLAGGLAGGGLVWQQQQREMRQLRLAAAATSGWLQRAALAHSVYSAEPRHPVEVRAQEDHLARWLTRRVEVPVRLYDLRALGFELLGGRLLPDGDGRSAQLMYQDAQGLRVTVYLRKPEPGSEGAFRFEQRGPLGLLHWVERDCGYALVGPLPRETLVALGEAIEHQHEAATAPPRPPVTGS